jgi:hypothetical protein
MSYAWQGGASTYSPTYIVANVIKSRETGSRDCPNFVVRNEKMLLPSHVDAVLIVVVIAGDRSEKVVSVLAEGSKLALRMATVSIRTTNALLHG